MGVAGYYATCLFCGHLNNGDCWGDTASHPSAVHVLNCVSVLEADSSLFRLQVLALCGGGGGARGADLQLGRSSVLP